MITRMKLLVVLLLIVAGAVVALAGNLGTAFTYQGQLKQNGGPFNGTVSMRFELYDALTDGNLLAYYPSPQGTAVSVTVTNGLFTRDDIDFGQNVFTGEARWLQVYVGTPATALTPRQKLTPTPYALALPGLFTQQNPTSPNILGGYSGNTVATGVVGGTVAGGGNAGATNRVSDHYGTVGGGSNNSAQAPHATIAGGQENSAISGSSTIGGGHHNQTFGNWSVIGGGEYNAARNNWSTVGGGQYSDASGDYATVGGGLDNNASGLKSTISGGMSNVADGERSFVGGGEGNVAHAGSAISGGYHNAGIGAGSVIGGGSWNVTGSDYATVPGGLSNSAGGIYSFAAGWNAIVRDSLASGDPDGDEGTFVWADSQGVNFESTGPDQFLIRAAGGVGINKNNPQAALDVDGSGDAIRGRSTAGAGVGGTSVGSFGVHGLSTDGIGVEGASTNSAGVHGWSSNNTGVWGECGSQNPGYSGVAGVNQGPGAGVYGRSDGGGFAGYFDGKGYFAGNVGIGTSSPAAKLHVSGISGVDGIMFPDGSTQITAWTGGGGSGWGLTGNADTNPATNFLGTTDNQALEVKVNNARALRVEPNATSPNIIGGHASNAVTPGIYGATIGGGGATEAPHSVTGSFSTVGGGYGNSAGIFSTVAGGEGNTASNIESTIGGGQDNVASGYFTTVAGGSANVASGHNSTIGGGVHNAASGEYATVSGGGGDNLGNTAGGNHSTVAGGQLNTASANWSVVGGGDNNTAGTAHATVGGGRNNTARGRYSTVPGGYSCEAGGESSFAAGTQAHVRSTALGDPATDDGTFVWADFTSADFVSTGPDQFLIRAAGGVGIGTNDPAGYSLNVDGSVNATDLLINGVSVGGGGGGIGGGGTKSYIAKFTGATAIGNSVLYEFGGNVGIGTTSPGAKLDVISTSATDYGMRVQNSAGGLDSAALRVENTGTTGYGIRCDTAGSGTSLVLGNNGTGRLIEGFSDNGQLRFKVDHDGTTTVSVLEITGADLAEKFPVSEKLEPGMVVEIDPDHPGQLRLSREGYNRRVAGVVSGAGNLPAGAILGNLPESKDGPPIALSGRVWVYCDAAQHAVQPGDLLTTSDSPGHAMKVTDYPRAQGAIIGKAMSGLKAGERGLVLVLVSLQ